jgi:phosphatidate cytidylyltransferase
MFSFFILGYFFKLPFNVYELLAFGLVIGTLGQLGDFIESGLKRDVGVKDSSNLLSEHGGILDRFDSIMYTAPFVLILLQFFLN